MFHNHISMMYNKYWVNHAVLLKAIVLKLIKEDNNIVVIDSDITDKLYFKCYKALNAIR